MQHQDFTDLGASDTVILATNLTLRSLEAFQLVPGVSVLLLPSAQDFGNETMPSDFRQNCSRSLQLLFCLLI